MVFELWIVKRISDLRSGKPEVDVELFMSEAAARDYVAAELEPKGFVVSDDQDPEPMQWYLGDEHLPDEWAELEGAGLLSGKNEPMSKAARDWLKQKCDDEVNIIFDQAETRKAALDWAAVVDEVMAHHDIAWSGGKTATQRISERLAVLRGRAFDEPPGCPVRAIVLEKAREIVASWSDLDGQLRQRWVDAELRELAELSGTPLGDIRSALQAEENS